VPFSAVTGRYRRLVSALRKTGWVVGGAVSGWFVLGMLLPLFAILVLGVHEDDPLLWDVAGLSSVVGALGGGLAAWFVWPRRSRGVPDRQ
jgi:hypothetical protein